MNPLRRPVDGIADLVIADGNPSTPRGISPMRSVDVCKDLRLAHR
jgi:hypothetical protein